MVKRKILPGIFVVICLSVFVFSIYKIYRILSDHDSNQKEVESIQEEIILNKEVIEKEPEKKEESEDSYELKLDFSKLKEMNSDTIGWIEIRNTNINYPFVQTSDNDYYLGHSFTKSVNGDGWIFVSYINKNDFTDSNTILFGHDTHGRGMFSDLKKLYNGLLGNFIPITIYLENETIHYETFSIFLTDENSNQFLKTRLYHKDIEAALKQSKYDFKVEVGDEESFLTLSTCYNSSSNKVILIAKRV